MNLKPTLLLAVTLAFGVPAFAEDYAVTGDDFAGRATIDREAGTYAIEGLRFGVKTNTLKGAIRPVPFSAHGVLEVRGDDLALGTTTTRRQINGVVSWLRLDFTQQVEETHFDTFTATEAGGFSGTLQDQPLTLVPQPDTSDLSVLVVPGLSTNLWNQYGVPYLDENMAALEARGLSARRLAINTEQSVAVNAAQIGAEIRAEVAAGKRVLLIAHSKGGADTITALADPKNADLLPHVAGFVAIQPVYAGSRIADFVADGTPVSHILHEACGDRLNAKLLGALQKGVDVVFRDVLPLINRVDRSGSPDAVRDLRSRARLGLLARHPYPADKVPTVVVRGFMDDRSFFKPRHVLRGPLVVFQAYTELELGEPSDGMVTLDSQSIPGAVAEITLADLDHFEPGFRGESPHKPVAITNQGLELVFPHLKAKPEAQRGRPTVDLELGD
jgi:hypothetical protein